jgi:hypothetical protein
MPYIPFNSRIDVDLTRRTDCNAPATPGELNFVISRVVNLYLERQGIDYSMFNDVVGVLECLKMEIYRRLIAHYEDAALRRNGDVFSGWVTTQANVPPAKGPE